MSAVIKEVDQRSDDWFALRAGKFTSSRMSDLMAKTKSGPSASRGNLISLLAVERLTGTCVETYCNAAMQRGIDLESEARDAYSFETGRAVAEVGYVECTDLPWTSSSPDGLVGDDGMVEIKVPASMQKHVNALRTGAHAKEYQHQVQHQMLVTGREWNDVVSYDPRFPEGLQLAITRVERDEKAIAEMREAIAAADIEVTELVAELEKMKEKTA